MPWQYAIAIAATFSCIAGCGDVKTLAPKPLAVEGQVARHGDWAVGCDNLSRCTAIGVPAIQTQTNMPYEMALIYQVEGGLGAIGTMTMLPMAETIIDDIELFQIGNLPSDRGRRYRFTYEPRRLPPESGFELRKMMSAGKVIIGINDKSEEPRVRFPQTGYAKIDQAISNQRTKYQSRRKQSVEPQPEILELVSASEGVRQDALRDMREGLPCDLDSIPLAPIVYTLADGARLVALNCNRLSRNSLTHWYQYDGQKAEPFRVVLPEPRGNVPAAIDGLYNSTFDPDSSILQSVAFSGSEGDCGILRRWAITVNGWQLVERREMPFCGRGIARGYWIRTYRAENVGGGWLE
jgi:Protein of unknown function (DUF1176)